MSGAPKSGGRKPEDLVILYVEDDPDTLEFVTEYLRQHWNPESCGVRSLDEALDLVQDEGFTPDLVLHDCKPLRHPDDERDSLAAGDELYDFFVSEGLAVAVVTGQAPDEMKHEEPYSRTPPLCWLEKPLTQYEHGDGEIRWKQIDEAVSAYLRSRSGEAT